MNANRNQPVMKTDLIHFTILSLLAVVFLFPSLLDIDYWGIHDWDVHITDHAVERDSIVQYRQWPLWNPYKGGGCPALGHARSICLSPLFILFLLWGPVVGLKIMTVVCMAIGLIGTYKLAREWGISPTGAYTVAFIFMFSSHFPLKIAEGTTEYLGQCWLPWMVYFSCRLIRFPEKWIKYSILTAFSFSLLLLQGGGNDPAFNLLLISIIFVIESIRLRKIKVIGMWGVVILLTVIVSAIKILPMMETSRSMWRLTYPNEYQPQTRLACAAAFLSPDQQLDSPDREKSLKDPGIWNWEDHGCYVGWGALLLAAYGLFAWRRKRLLLGILLLFFIFLYMGHLAPIDLWYWIHKLPIFCYLRIPSRSGYCTAFIIGLLAGYGVNNLQAKVRGRKCLKVLLVALPIIIFVNYAMVDWPILGNVYIRPPEIFKRGLFIQNAWPVTRGSRETVISYSRLYPKYLQNQGEVDAYSNMAATRNAIAADSPWYKGEAWILEPAPSDYCHIVRYTPNAIRLEVSSEKPNRVILNQNYLPGWGVAGIQNVRPEMYRGKISIVIPSGNHNLELYYWPRTFTWGLIITLLALTLSIWFLIKPFRPGWFIAAIFSLFAIFAIYAVSGIQSPAGIEWFKRALDNEFYGNKEMQPGNLRKALSYYPDSVEVREMLQASLDDRWEEGDYGVLDEMIINLEQLTKLRPYNPEHYTNLGNIYMRKGLRAMARSQYEKALKVQPGYQPAMTELQIIGK